MTMEEEKKQHVIKMTWRLEDPPADAVSAWGARAIATNKTLDIPHDRQTYYSGPLSEKDSDKFIKWINTRGMPRLKAFLQNSGWNLSSDDVFSFDDGHYHLKASCRASYGYCYITAWTTKASKSA